MSRQAAPTRGAPPDPRDLAVVVPAWIPDDAAMQALRTCLDALLACRPAPARILVVDDGSPRPLDLPQGVDLLRQDNAGPAAARNAGARAVTQPIIVFVDADVEVPPNAMGRLVEVLRQRPEAGAVWATVSARCPRPELLSRYKNLAHRHFTLRMAADGAPTPTPHLTTMLAAVRRPAFDQVGGFDTRLRTVSVEDVAFGRALVAAGWPVLLDPGLAVAHHHRFTPARVLRNDAHKLRRLVALPDTGAGGGDAATARQRAYALGAPLGLLALTAGAVGAWPLAVAATGGLALAERDLLRFIARHEGPAFAAASLPVMCVERSVALAAGAVGLVDRLRGVRR